MSNSLTRRTTLGLLPLVLGVLLRHYYSKLVKDKGTGKECVAVPLRNKELMYDEAFSVMRVSYSFFYIPSFLLIKSRISWTHQRGTPLSTLYNTC